MHNFVFILLAVFMMSHSTVAVSEQSSSEIDNGLSMLIGEWTVSEEIAMRPDRPKLKGKGKAYTKWGPGKNSVIIEYQTIEGPLKGFSLTEVISKEAEEGEFSLAWVDSFTSGIKIRKGTKLKDGSFQFTSDVVRNGEKIKVVSIIKSIHNSFNISTFHQRLNEEPTLFMSLTHTPSKE